MKEVFRMSIEHLDSLISQLFDTASEIMDELNATDFEMKDVDVLTDKTIQVIIKAKEDENRNLRNY